MTYLQTNDNFRQSGSPFSALHPLPTKNGVFYFDFKHVAYSYRVLNLSLNDPFETTKVKVS
jgi:hypothetical protein